jgi:hypothetical protein
MTMVSVSSKFPARTRPLNITTRQNYAAKQPLSHQTTLQFTPEVHYAAYSLTVGLCGGDFNTLTPSRPIDSSR